MIQISTRAFDHQIDGDFPGSRGTVIETDRPHASGIVFSTCMPDVYISDAGDVDFNGYRVPAEDMLAWMRAVAEQIHAQLPEVSGDLRPETAPSIPASPAREGAAAGATFPLAPAAHSEGATA